LALICYPARLWLLIKAWVVGIPITNRVLRKTARYEPLFSCVATLCQETAQYAFFGKPIRDEVMMRAL